MKDEEYEIVVTGDLCVAILQWITHHQQTNSYNWKLHPTVHYNIKTGGANLLAKLIESTGNVKVLTPKLTTNEIGANKEFLSTTALLEQFPTSGQLTGCSKVYRVKQFLGFSDPSSDSAKMLPVHQDKKDVDLVVLYDESNGFNMNPEYWPVAITSENTSPMIIYKMNNPTHTSKLWKHLEQYHKERMIVVITGDDLRAKGVNISKSLSWERTALDFMWQINNNPEIAYLARCQHLIVPFGLEGAIYYSFTGTVKASLFFLTYEFEDDFAKEDLGMMYGLASCFVAGLAGTIRKRSLLKEEFAEAIAEGIREGIVASQKYFMHGFGSDVEKSEFPNPTLFCHEDSSFIKKDHVQDVSIRNTTNSNCQACWYILKDKSSASLAEIAYNIVRYGEKDALQYIPIAKFGNLKTVDKTEIEGYRSIKNLMQEFVSSTNTVRPLSIAIFGTPGSGKSFGVSEIASTIAPELIQKLDFNLSQFRSITDLINAFHRVRDLILRGKIPLVFFDEFDTSFEGRLGWLKYFLAPMQDGVFREGDSIHPIGKAIFVFAGGTSSTYKEFCGEEITEEKERKQFIRDFQMAKGPDFISRLRGYVNILGPNQTNVHWDQLFIIRRAMLLRSMLERKTPHLINSSNVAQVDNGVIRALLKIPRYKHESRSMEAIIEMSRLTSAKKWEQSHLPSKDQLSLHVDEEQFLRHLMHDAFYGERVEIFAKRIYEVKMTYCNPNNSDYSGCTIWEELDEDLKNSYLEQAKSIPNALHQINYDTIAVSIKPEPITFTKSELMSLAAYEHKRWKKQKREDGWQFGERVDIQKKTHPYLISWDKLSEEGKSELVMRVKSWPYILSEANFKIERLKYLCYCENEKENNEL